MAAAGWAGVLVSELTQTKFERVEASFGGQKLKFSKVLDLGDLLVDSFWPKYHFCSSILSFRRFSANNEIEASNFLKERKGRIQQQQQTNKQTKR